MDAETIKWALGGIATTAIFGRWIVPLLGRLLENATASATASGNVLATVQAERDQWKARAEELDNTLQAFRKDWAEMKSKFDLMEYQLNQALAQLQAYRERKDG